jgi:PrtD family type I secretion system ABC transporter
MRQRIRVQPNSVVLRWRNRKNRHLVDRREDLGKLFMAKAQTSRPLSGPGELKAALAACRQAFLGVGLMSALINVLTLTGSLFMLQVYDRVLPSRSVPTLLGLAMIVAFLYAFQGMLEVLRGRVLTRIGASLDERLSRRAFDVVVRLPLKAELTGDGLQPVRDIDQVRSFLSGAGPTALFDLPWMPFYIAICFIFHPLLGVTALGGGLLLVVLTIVADWRTREHTARVASLTAARNNLAEAGRRNAEALYAMGMADRLGDAWVKANATLRTSHQKAADVAGGLSTVSRVLRMVLQSAVLGVGAYLVIKQEATGGIMIAASIIVARALAPVELAIANWRGFQSARQSWRRLAAILQRLPVQDKPMDLPNPVESLAINGISVSPPGGRRVVVQDASFTLKAGSGLGVIGPSASGKSSLVRTLVGVWTPVRGSIRLDGATLDQWTPEKLGRHLGYLPQDVELFDGTVAENIARFESDADPQAIMAAAKAAGVHELILRLPDGYDTRIGDGGTALSAGQRQRLALARALYGDPFLVVLDEPNSNLDTEGEAALTQAIRSIRERGGIVIVVAHRSSALATVDQILVLNEGRMQEFGPKEEVLRKVLRPRPAAGPAIAAVGGDRP